MSFKFLNEGQSGNIQQFTPIDTFIDPVSKIRVSNPSNLIDTDFEYGLQPTKWETVELINNTPAFFSKGGDTTIPDLTGITTNAGTREITVTTAFPHNLAVGIPIRVAGTKSVTADGSYIINATPSLNTFTYLSRANQTDTLSIFDLYSSIITGEFFQGSQISISDAEGITTDGAGPISTLTIKTENRHGFGNNTPFYFLNLNSTISQEFESANSSSLSFDPTNSATAQSFDGSNTLLKTPIDLSNSASTSIQVNDIQSTEPSASTITVALKEDWTSLKIGDPLYYSVIAGGGYFQANPRGVVFIKNIDQIDVTNTNTATFQVSLLPTGPAIPVLANMQGTFQLADQARTFPGNNVDLEDQIEINIFKDEPIPFDGGNQGYVGVSEDPPNNEASVLGYSGTTINLLTSEGVLDYYVGAMLKYTTNGTPPTGLTNNATYFVKSFNTGAAAGLYVMSIAALPDQPAISIDGGSASGSQLFDRIGISVDRDIVHVRDANFDQGELIEYIPPTQQGSFLSDSIQKYYFVKKAFDAHNYELNDNPFIPILATGGTVSDAFYDGRTYRTHKFTSTGANNFVVDELGTDPEIEILVIAGGGSGGSGSTTNANGGGGAGGVLYAKRHSILETGTKVVTVGAGGPGVTWRSDNWGNNGGNSSFGSELVAIGGGGGGSRGTGTNRDNRPGGSGGGTAYYNSNFQNYTFNSGVSTQEPAFFARAFGNDGAYSAKDWNGGGGGGANESAQLYPNAGGRGQIGTDGVQGSWGGFGQSFNIEGRPIFYAGGGGGGGNSSERGGDGFHGGGRGHGQVGSYEWNEYDLNDPPTVFNGSSRGNSSLHASANTGSGGGAGSYWSNNVSWGGRTTGRGGSGIVIIRYPISPVPEFKIMQATGGNQIFDVVDTDGAWRVHKFTTPGSSTFNVTEPGSHGIEFLVVGGGGAGGNGVTTNANGGGGGGGVVHSTSYNITQAGNIPVFVGAGGAGSVFQRDTNGDEGQDSSFNTIFVGRGGGGGGGRGSGGSLNATPGGSAGGKAYYNNAQTNFSNQTYTFSDANGTATGFGNRGGRRDQTWTGAGGGGAGTQGHDGNYQSIHLRSGDGGYGYRSTIEGQIKYYAGGGGGGGNSSERAGDGWAGGGRGFARTSYYDFNQYPAEGTIHPVTLGSATLNAVNNTGGGGGATSYWSNNTSWGTRGAGSGGHGVVIIRYRIIPPEFLGYESRMIATGGEINDIVVEEAGFATLYRTHAFKKPGNSTFTISDMGNLGDGTVEYLIVAGGGGGGSDVGGGGGAGGLLQGKLSVQPGAYPVTVGNKGNGAVGYNNFPPLGGKGGNSVLGNLTAIGGGGGSSGHYYQPGSSYVGPEANTVVGGSGGGGSAAYFNVAQGRAPGQGTPGQGTAGGFGKYTNDYHAGGGGGAGGNPEVNYVNGSRAGNGGPGLISNILGYPYYFAGGGGGAIINNRKAGNGGLGGGAPGGRWDQFIESPYRDGLEGYGGLNISTSTTQSQSNLWRQGPTAGPNTGGGGGGGVHQGRGGDGGTGIVVVRYPISTKRRLPQ